MDRDARSASITGPYIRYQRLPSPVEEHYYASACYANGEVRDILTALEPNSELNYPGAWLVQQRALGLLLKWASVLLRRGRAL